MRLHRYHMCTVPSMYLFVYVYHSHTTTQLGTLTPKYVQPVHLLGEYSIDTVDHLTNLILY